MICRIVCVCLTLCIVHNVPVDHLLMDADNLSAAVNEGLQRSSRSQLVDCIARQLSVFKAS